MSDESEIEEKTTSSAAKSPYRDALEKFVAASLSILNTVPPMLGYLALLATWLFRKTRRLSKQLIDSDEDFFDTAEGIATLAVFRNRREQFESTKLVLRRNPGAFLVSLLTEYDILITKTYRALLNAKPDIAIRSNKSVDIAEVFKHSSLDDFKKNALDRAVNEFGRASRSEQIDQLDKAAGLNIKNYLFDFPSLIEISERRNLVVHTDGAVNEQYLARCKAASVVSARDLPLGTKLEVDREYLQDAVRVITVAGIIIVHLIWRKMSPGQMEEADGVLNDTGYSLLRSGRYAFARDVLRFGAVELKKHSNDSIRRMMVINYANALRLCGDSSAGVDIYEKEDWSSSALEFRLAGEILKKNHTAAADLMKEIGSSHKMVSKSSYHEWPIFSGFRKTEEFKAAYSEVFGEPYSSGLLKEEEVDQLDAVFESFQKGLSHVAGELEAAAKEIEDKSASLNDTATAVIAVFNSNEDG